MSTHPTALDLDLFDAALDSVASASYSDDLAVSRLRRRLHNVTRMLSTVMVTPLSCWRYRCSCSCSFRSC